MAIKIPSDLPALHAICGKHDFNAEVVAAVREGMSVNWVEGVSVGFELATKVVADLRQRNIFSDAQRVMLAVLLDAFLDARKGPAPHFDMADYAAGR